MRFGKHPYGEENYKQPVKILPLNEGTIKDTKLQDQGCNSMFQRRRVKGIALQYASKQRAQRIDSFSLILMPIIFILACIIYWIYYQYG